MSFELMSRVWWCVLKDRNTDNSPKAPKAATLSPLIVYGFVPDPEVLHILQLMSRTRAHTHTCAQMTTGMMQRHISNVK